MKRKPLFYTTGIVSFFYWFLPIAQNQLFTNYSDRANDHTIFVISVRMFFGASVVSYGLAYFLLIAGFFISWWALYSFGTLFIKKD